MNSGSLLTEAKPRDLSTVGPAARHVQTTVFRLLSGADTAHWATRAVAFFLATLILLNVTAAILETVQQLRQSWERLFELFDWFSVIVFTAEYLLRVWACTVDERYAHRIYGRLRYALTPLMLIDLVAIAPFYAASVVIVDLRTLRAVRLVRLLRVLKIARYSESLQLLGRVLVSRRGELLMTLVAVAVLLVISSTLMYHVERDAQPEQFSSIPAAMWWGVETLTTIGYSQPPLAIPVMGPTAKPVTLGLAANRKQISQSPFPRR